MSKEIICKICNKKFSNIQGLSKHIGAQHKEISKKQYYLQYIKINDNYICPICGKETPFLGLSYGFQKHCSSKCAGKDENTILKRENNNLIKFGTKYNFQSEQFKECAKQTKLEKYGDENYNNRELAKQTCITKYGVTNPAKSNEIQEKIKETSLQKYGTNRPQQSQKVKLKYKETCLIKYGTESYWQTQEFKNKYRQTSLIKYGTENPSQSIEIKNKVQQTCIKKYNVSSVFKLQRVKDAANSKEAIKKMNDTKRKNGTFNTSKSEDEFYKELKTIFNEVERNYKSEEYPYCCDFYISELDLYIELNLHWTHGKYWFDKNNLDDIETLNKWKEKSETSKFYKNAIYVWTILDIKKREIAINNKLNYVVLWNNNDIDEFLRKYKK